MLKCEKRLYFQRAQRENFFGGVKKQFSYSENFGLVPALTDSVSKLC